MIFIECVCMCVCVLVSYIHKSIYIYLFFFRFFSHFLFWLTFIFYNAYKFVFIFLLRRGKTCMEALIYAQRSVQFDSDSNSEWSQVGLIKLLRMMNWRRRNGTEFICSMLSVLFFFFWFFEFDKCDYSMKKVLRYLPIASQAPHNIGGYVCICLVLVC